MEGYETAVVEKRLLVSHIVLFLRICVLCASVQRCKYLLQSVNKIFRSEK